jgi:hypothetical protein
MTTKQSPWLTAYAIAGAAFVVAVLLFTYLNVPLGPNSQTEGVVESWAFIPNDGPPSKVASVRLKSGAVVQVWVGRDLDLRQGDFVQIDVHRRFITGAETYGVVRVQPKS